jgi:hypothetical protein
MHIPTSILVNSLSHPVCGRSFHSEYYSTPLQRYCSPNFEWTTHLSLACRAGEIIIRQYHIMSPSDMWYEALGAEFYQEWNTTTLPLSIQNAVKYNNSWGERSKVTSDSRKYFISQLSNYPILRMPSYSRSRDSSLKAMDRAVGVGFQQGQGISVYSIASRPALGSTHLPIQWVPGTLFPGVKRLRCDADHLRLLPWSRMAPLFLHSSMCLHSIALN